MKFIVTRTSSNTRPCDGVRSIPWVKDETTFTSYLLFTPDEWYRNGWDHKVGKVYDDGAKRLHRKVMKARWVKDFDTLEQLLEFVKANGVVVLSDGPPEIEIYDVLRE